MSKHFEDALYYQKRAGVHAKLGLAETLEAVENRVRSRIGREKEAEPEPTRVESLVGEVKEVEQRAKLEGREKLGTARQRFGRLRSSQ